jgi:two-component system cell cycle response regulator DivK
MTESGSEKGIVLVVDGDFERRFLTAVSLQRLDYHVFPVKSAEEALMALELTSPIIVITDITLPQMSGTELLRSIKARPDLKDVPVLIYTALKDPSYRKACEEAGCAGYLLQPADHNQLYEAIQRATEDLPRHVVRLATSLDVIVEGEALREGAGKKERVTAISEHGMYVATPEPLARGAVALFTLFLDRSTAWGIRVEGTVLYANADGGQDNPAGMGVKFTEIRPEDRAAVRNFIGKKILAGIAVPVRSSNAP